MHHPVLTLGPPIARPKKRYSQAHVLNSPIIATPGSSKVNLNMQSLPKQLGNLHASGSFDLGSLLKDHSTNIQSSNDINFTAINNKTHSRKIGMSSSERRRFSIDLSDISKLPDKGKKLQHSPSFRKNHISVNNISINDSPLAFDAQANENFSEKEEESQLIGIIIHSNWGDHDFLRISSICILDDKFMSVPILKYTLSPDLGINRNCLFGGHLMKTESNDLFTIPWAPDHEPVRIAIFVPSDVIISGVRIFNSENSLDSSVKDISLVLDNSNTLNGEVPRNFGIDFKFTQKMRKEAVESSRLIDNFFLEIQEKSFEDKYGLYPLFSTKTLYFELTKSWSNENLIGLNGIQIFDQNNKLIQIDHIDDIIVHHCVSSNDPSLLLKKDLKTSLPERQFLTKTIPGKFPLIEIIFKENHFISRVIVWNFNSSRDPVEYGVRNMKISVDESLVWCGKIKKAVGNEIGADKTIKTVWLTDSMEMRCQATNNF